MQRSVSDGQASDELMPRPQPPVYTRAGDIDNTLPDKIKNLKVQYIEAVYKITSMKARKERLIVVGEHFIFFLNGGAVSKMVCLNEIHGVYYQQIKESKYRFAFQIGNEEIFRWESNIKNQFNTTRGLKSPWGVVRAINNGRGLFRNSPLGIIKIADVCRVEKSSGSRLTIIPGMDICMVKIKKTEGGGVGLLVSPKSMVLSGIEADTPASRTPELQKYIGWRITHCNGHEVCNKTELLQRSKNRKTVTLLFSNSLPAVPVTGVLLPQSVSVCRESETQDLGLDFGMTLCLRGVSDSVESPCREFSNLIGLVLIKVNDVYVSSPDEVRSMISGKTNFVFTFDSHNEVLINLPGPPESAADCGVQLTDSLQVVDVQRRSPAALACAQFKTRFKVSRVNGEIVGNIEEFEDSIRGYPTIRLGFETMFPCARS